MNFPNSDRCILFYPSERIDLNNFLSYLVCLVLVALVALGSTGGDVRLLSLLESSSLTGCCLGLLLFLSVGCMGLAGYELRLRLAL